MPGFDDTGLFKGKHKGWMEISSGRKVNPLNVREEDVDIEIIAHALSHICRYGGHCKKFYSVADHSMRVARILPDKYKLAGLLHDASEAYLGDVIRPLKYSMPSYRELEERTIQTIMAKFHIPYTEEVKEAIKSADNIIGATEGRDLMYHSEDWGNLPEPLVGKIEPISPSVAKMFFLMRFAEYGGYLCQEGI